MTRIVFYSVFYLYDIKRWDEQVMRQVVVVVAGLPKIVAVLLGAVNLKDLYLILSNP